LIAFFLCRVFNYFYYFCVSGKFLVAGERLQGNTSARVASLKRENNTDMQLWKIEAGGKKM